MAKNLDVDVYRNRTTYSRRWRRIFSPIQHTYSPTGTATTTPPVRPIPIQDTNTKPQACPQTAKECPDGSYVGPTGPNCAFVCPISTTNHGHENFSASPASGTAPLSVQFTSSAPQGSTIGNAVNFGDGASEISASFRYVRAVTRSAPLRNTYASAGIYTGDAPTEKNWLAPSGGNLAQLPQHTDPRHRKKP